MKTKRTLTIAAVLVALAALMTLGIFRGTRQVQAQDETPPPIPDRFSFGMIGIARGQTARLNVTNAEETHGIIIEFRLVDGNGEVLLRNNGQPIERTITLEPGRSAFLQMNADNVLGRDEVRRNFRAEVTVTGASGEVVCPCNSPVTLEVIDSANGRTAYAMYTPPGVERMGLRLNHNETLVRDVQNRD